MREFNFMKRTLTRGAVTAIVVLAATPGLAAAQQIQDGDVAANVSANGVLGTLQLIDGRNDLFRESMSVARIGVDTSKRVIEYSTPTVSGSTATATGAPSGDAGTAVATTVSVTDAGATGYMTRTVTVTNQEAVPRTYAYYHYIDLDIPTSFTNSAAAEGANGLRQTGDAGFYTFIAGQTPDGRWTGTNPEDSSPTLSYAGPVPTVASGDARMLIEQRATIPAGGSFTFRTRVAGDSVAPTITVPTPTATISRPIVGERIGLDRRVPIDFACTDATSCTATVDGTPIADGDLLPTSSLGTHNIVVTASNGGTSSTASRSYTVVIPTVSLAISGSGELINNGLGFRPSDTNLDYTGSLTLSVTSDAGPSTVTVQDLGDDPGYLINPAQGTPGLLQSKLEARVGAAGYEAIGRAPLFLTTLSDPITGPTLQTTSVDIRQKIAANEPLRSGTYGKTLTFTVLATGP